MRYLISILISAGSLLSAADFFPLSPGNYWRLRSSQGATQEIQVGFTLLSYGQQDYYRLSGYRAERTWLTREPSGDLKWLDLDNESTEVLTRFGVEPGGYWTRLGVCPQRAQVKEQRVEWGKAGRRLPALQIQYEGGCADNSILEELYLENIGLVRRVVSTLAGPVRYELAEARVGDLIFADQAGSMFDVSLPQATYQSKDGTVETKVNIRLSIRNTEPMRLFFGTIQEFELKLFDPNGTLIWRWSEDRAFLPVIREELLLEKSWNQEVSWKGLRPGIYTVEGSLTNSGPYRFASTTQIRID